MNISNGNQPAFPISETTTNGLSKREYFAALALQGILSHYSSTDYELTPDAPMTVAKAAINYADALIDGLSLYPVAPTEEEQ